MGRALFNRIFCFILTSSVTASARTGALRADMGSSKSSNPGVSTVTFGNPFDATAALRDLQEYYLRRAAREDERLRRNEELRREEEYEGRRRDAERDYERALLDARKLEREARDAEQRARRNEEAERRREALLDEIARRQTREDAELSAEEDQRSVERARRYAEQSLERLRDNVVVKTLVKDVSAVADYARSEIQRATSLEGAVERLRDLTRDPSEVSPPGAIADSVASLNGIFHLAASSGEEEASSLGPTLGGWLADQVREKLVDSLTQEVRQRLNRLLGGPSCGISDAELNQACDDAWRETNPINLLRGPRTYFQTLFETHLHFMDVTIPRVQGQGE